MEHKLDRGLRMSETEIDKLYCHYRAKWDYRKLSELLRTRRTSYIIEDLERTMLYIRVPYSRDWQSRKEWIDENEANASGKVNILCNLACEKILSLKKRIRAMRKMAECYALGYGVEKDIYRALLWADALETYELEINNIK